MSKALVPAYTQADLDADVIAISNGIDSIVMHVARIKDPANWSQVQHLHPGVGPIEYMRKHIPWLDRNSSAGAALVNARVTTTRDAGRLIGTSHAAVSKAAAKGRLVTQVTNPGPKPTTLATGKTAPGPPVGSVRVGMSHVPAGSAYAPKPKAVVAITVPHVMAPEVIRRLMMSGWDTFANTLRSNLPSTDPVFDAAVLSFLTETEARLRKV